MMARERLVVVGGVECVLDWPEKVTEDVRRFDVVFLLHQRQGRREDLEEEAKELSGNGGFLVVRWDAPNHGARLVHERTNDHWLQGNLTNAQDMFAQMFASMQELQLLIEFLPAKLGIEFRRVGVLGFSQGGHTALLAFSNEPKIDVCVSCLSAGDYQLMLEKRYDYFCELVKRKNRDPLPPFIDLFPASLSNLMQSFDSIHNIDKVSKGFRPLLMINGGADKLVPPDCNQSLHAQLAPMYQSAGHEGDLKLTIIDELKHEVTPSMRTEAYKFLYDKLRSKL